MVRLLALLLFLATPALAIDPERREVTVISGRVWDGFEYKEMFLPSSAPEMTILAGQDSAISFATTQEYYWPLSRQVYVDFESQRDVLSGKLRIERDGQLVAEVEEAPFAILYPEGAVNGNGQLLWGAEAAAGFADYEAGERDFNRRFVAAQRANTAYEKALLEAARSGSKAVIPPPPPVPDPSLRLVTRPQPAFRLSLAEGDYRIALVAKGTVLPGTERRLRVITAESRDAVVADIIPEERWTRPIPANSPEARIYARAGGTFYLTLSQASRFAETDYLSIVSPQALAVEGRDLWVRRKPSPIDTLKASSGAEAGDLSRLRLKVEQTSASGFGYVVRPAREGETAELEAFAVEVPGGSTGPVLLSNGAGGFERIVIPVGSRQAGGAFLLALGPLLLWGAARLVGRARRKPG